MNTRSRSRMVEKQINQNANGLKQDYVRKKKKSNYTLIKLLYLHMHFQCMNHIFNLITYCQKRFFFSKYHCNPWLLTGTPRIWFLSVIRGSEVGLSKGQWWTGGGRTCAMRHARAGANALVLIGKPPHAPWSCCELLGYSGGRWFGSDSGKPAGCRCLSISIAQSVECYTSL